MLRSLLLAVIMVATMIADGPAVAQQPIKLTYATYLPKTFTWVQVDDWFMDEVTRRSNGQVKFERYYGGTLLAAKDVFPGLSKGVADLGTGAPGYNPELLPLSGVLQPFITEKVDAAAAALIDLYEQNPAFRKEWQTNNMHLVYALTATENSMWTRKSVRTAADLKGLRIRATLGIGKALELLGATPVAMDIADGLQAFKSGAIDGFTSAPFDVGTLIGLQDTATYVGDHGRMGVYACVDMAFNKQSYDKLPAGVKAIIADVSKEIPARFLNVTDKAVDASVAKIKAARNLQVIRLSDSETNAWREKTRAAVWDAWTKDMDAKGLNGTAVLRQYRDLVAKREAGSRYVPGHDRLVQR